MTNLAQLQQEMFACIHHGDVLKTLEISETKGFCLETRLSIYQHAYFLRLKDALSTNYPATSTVLGEQAFTQLARDYIAHYPSVFKSIRWFGDNLAEFISNHVQCEYRLAIAELAHFEWLQTCVFDAANEHVLTIQELSQVAPNEWFNLIFKAHASVYRINLKWNVVAVWNAINAGEIVPEFKKNESDVPWILWRQNNLNRFSSLPEEEAIYLDALISGSSFAELLVLASERMPMESTAAYIASLLKSWLDVGLISQFNKKVEACYEE